jgi:hypothetical protein
MNKEVIKMLERKIAYFEEYGPQNTEKVIEIVKSRIERGDIQTIVGASSTGKTGIKLSEALSSLANIIIVSHGKMNPQYKKQIIERGGKAVEKTHLPLHLDGMDDIRESFRTFGQGFKVAVEVILIAADTGQIPLYNDVIGIGGTARGSDTAIIARGTTTEEIFSRDRRKNLEIREVLAMPLKQKWWA